MARFMAALALAYMFDGRYSKLIQLISTFKIFARFVSVSLEGATIMDLKHINASITTFMEAAAFSCAPSMLAQVTEKAGIPEAGHLRCSGSEIGRFVTMLRNPSPVYSTWRS